MDVIISNAHPDEYLNLEVKKKYKIDLPSFSMLGNDERRTRRTNMDMYAILKDLSKGGTYYFWLFVEKRVPATNEVAFIPADNAEAKRLSKAYKELHSLKLIKRVKRGEYLINPSAHLPTTSEYANVLAVWDALP